MVIVVHVRKSLFKQGHNDCVYIGRNYSEFTDEGWGNPFHIGPDGDRAEVLKKYRAMVMKSPRLRARIEKELKGRDLMLGCWCKPEACHGDVLAEIANADTDDSTGRHVHEVHADGLHHPLLSEEG